MTHEQIKSFLAVIQHGSLNKAAEHLYITQPALSYRISTLENELGGPLFTRKRGTTHISLTSLGIKFVQQAEKLDQIYKETEALLHSNNPENFYISSSNSLSFTILWDFYHAVQRNLEEDQILRFNLSVAPYNIAYQKVKSGELDLALVIYPRYSPQTTTTAIAKERIVLCCHPNTPFPEVIDYHMLDPSREIYLSLAENYINWHHKYFNPNIEPMIRSNQVYSGARFLIHDKAWAFFPMGIAQQLVEEGKARILNCNLTPPPRTIYAVQNNDRKNKNQDFVINILKQTILESSYLEPCK